MKISVNHNGKTFGGTLSLDKTTEGNDIQYGLTINKENQQTALVISSKTITGWNPVNKGNQDLAEKEAENVLEIGDFLLNDGSVVDKGYDLSKITAAGKTVVGVVYYVGNPQPSVLYKTTKIRIFSKPKLLVLLMVWLLPSIMVMPERLPECLLIVRNTTTLIGSQQTTKRPKVTSQQQ